jgi:NAD+ diphosphatase
MLKTPPSFVPLHLPRETSDAHRFVYRGDELLLRAGDLALPDASVCAALGIESGRSFPVGLLNNRYCSASWLDRDTPPPAGYEFKQLRPLFGALDDDLLAVAGRAFQIAEWARTHRYCGVCATPMTAVAGERCFKCPACGHVAYPRISPAMMVLVRRGDTILLARHAASLTNRFSALAGFLEPGESIEDAVHREVFEEVGLRVKNLAYFASQSWPFPHSLMIAFTAEYAGGDIVIDTNEIAEARWFGPGDELPVVSPGFSIAGTLIAAHMPASSRAGANPR